MIQTPSSVAPQLTIFFNKNWFESHVWYTFDMKKIYVASNEVARAKKVMEALRVAGHSITFDWTSDIGEGDKQDRIDKSLKEREAVRECDVLVYLWKDNQESARFEAGMAMGLRKKIIVVTDHQAWFFALPEVVQIDSDDQILSTINT